MAGPDGKWRKVEGGVSPFVDTSKSVGLTGAPQPGSVSQAVFVGESCDRECDKLVLDSRTTFTEQHSSTESSNARHDCCQLPDPAVNESEQSGGRFTQRYQERGELPNPGCFEPKCNHTVHNYCGHGQSPVRDGPELGLSKNNNARQNYCGLGQLPALDRSESEQDSSKSRQRYQGHGQLPGLGRAQLAQGLREYSKAPQGRHGHGQLPDHESRSENKFQSHGQLPDVGRVQSTQGWRESSKATILSEYAKEKYVPESGRQVAPLDGEEAYYTQVQTCNVTNNGNSRQAKIAELNEKWIQTKALMAAKNCDLSSTKRTIRELAEIGTELLHVRDGSVGDVAVGIGGTLVSPPFSLSQVEHYFGDIKGFPAITELVDIIKNGVPVKTSVTDLDPTRAMQYGNHSTVAEHMDLVWEKLYEDVRRNRVLVFDRESATLLKGLRVAPLGAVVTHKVRIINDYSFEAGAARGEKGGLNRDTQTEEVPKCLCGDALPALLKALTDLRIRFPHSRILLAKADVTDAFRNVRIAPHQAQNFCYVIDDVLVSDFRLTFGWAASPGYWGLMAAAVEHAHCNTTVNSAVILPEGKTMMSHVKIVKPWETGNPTRIPTGVRVNAPRRGGPNEPFLTSVYVDDFIMASVQLNASDQTALIASASLASDNVRLFGPGENGETPILAPKKSTNWNSTVDALGFTINTHTMRISVTKERIEAIRLLLELEWPRSKTHAGAQAVLSMAGKLWNLTYVVRAGRYFVWQLLRLTDLHKIAKSKQRTRRVVKLGWEFHNDIAFWKWAIDHKLVNAGESLGAPFYAHVQRTASRRYYSDASFTAVGGFCPELQVYWRYDLNHRLSELLRKQVVTKGEDAITINLLELCGMVMTAYVTQVLLKDRPKIPGDPVLLRGDNAAAVSWINRCGGSRNRRAALAMRLLGRLEITSGWTHDAKHIPGVQNVVADGISRWPKEQIARNLQSLVHGEWREKSIGQSGCDFFETILQPNFPTEYMDDVVWDAMTRTAES